MESTGASLETPVLLGSQIFRYLGEQLIAGKLAEGARGAPLSGPARKEGK